MRLEKPNLRMTNVTKPLVSFGIFRSTNEAENFWQNTASRDSRWLWPLGKT